MRSVSIRIVVYQIRSVWSAKSPAESMNLEPDITKSGFGAWCNRVLVLNACMQKLARHIASGAFLHNRLIMQ